MVRENEYVLRDNNIVSRERNSYQVLLKVAVQLEVEFLGILPTFVTNVSYAAAEITLHLIRK